MNIAKLKGKMAEKDVKVTSLAKVLGVDRATMYRKLNSFEKITIGEAVKIKEELKLTTEEALEIFLN